MRTTIFSARPRLGTVVWLLLACTFFDGASIVSSAAPAPSLDSTTTVEASPFEAIVTPSEPRKGCAATAPVRWLPQTVVSISFSRAEFSDSDKSAVRKAVDLWQKALAPTTIGIKLTIAPDVEPGVLPSPNQIILRRDHQMGEGNYGRIVASARPDRYLDSAVILINGSIHKRKILHKLLLHELGHALGLRDCSDCPSGKSVMNHFTRKSIAGFKVGDSNVASKPSASDLAQVVAGYKQNAKVTLATATDQQQNRQTITADETVALTPEAMVSANENLLAPYIKAAVHFSAYGSGAMNGRTLTKDETIQFASQLPALLKLEAATMEDLKNYSFRREVRIQTIDDKGRVSGEYSRTSDMVLDDVGRRVEQNVNFSKPTLRSLEITSEYVEDFSGAQLKGFELNQRDAYRFEPFGFETLNGKSVRVYRLTPLNLETAKATGARVLYGFIWIDEQTGAILKVAGRALPELKQRYPLFETHRELIDEKHLFPVRTLADDYLVFPTRRVHVRMLITYSNYKRFAGKVSIIDLDELQP